MQYRQLSPSASLQHIVKDYWCFQVQEVEGNSYPLQHVTLPDPTVSIVLIRQPMLSGVRLLGPHSRRFEQQVHSHSTYLGIRLLPWIRFSPALFDKKEILNQTADAPALLADHFSRFLDRELSLQPAFVQALEREILNWLNHVDIIQNDMVKFICLELSAGRKVGEIQAEIPASKRVIQKKFKEFVGVSMQDFAGAMKQRRVWVDILADKEQKVKLIHQHDFYDQPHFINDFKQKMNRTHTDFLIYMRKIKIRLD